MNDKKFIEFVLQIPILPQLKLGKTYILQTAIHNEIYTANINGHLGSGGWGVVYDGSFSVNNIREASAIKYMIISNDKFDQIVSDCKFTTEISLTCSDIAMKTFHITTFDIYNAEFRLINNYKLLVVCMEMGSITLENVLLEDRNTDELKIKMIESAIECAIRLNKRGFIHGDCFPKNMVISQSRIKLIDFGYSQYFNKNDFSEYGGIKGRGDERFVTTGVINNSIIPVDALFLISYILKMYYNTNSQFKNYKFGQNVLYRLHILFNTLYYECNRLSKINILDMFSKNQIFNRHVDDLKENIQKFENTEFNIKFDYVLLDNFMSGAYNDDKYNKNNDVKINEILIVDKSNLTINLKHDYKRVLDSKHKKDNYGVGYKNTRYDYSDVLSYNKNKCLTAKTYIPVKDILRHNLIPDTLRCLNECKIKSIYKYFEICLSYSIVNDAEFCQSVIDILEPCIEKIIIPHQHMSNYSNLYITALQNGEIYQTFPYLYSNDFVEFIKLITDGTRVGPFSSVFKTIDGYNKEKMLFYIIFLRYFSGMDGSNSKDWENFRQYIYRKYYDNLQSDRKKWKIENGGRLTISRNNIAVPNSNDDWGTGGQRCLNSKTHIMNKYSRKVGIPIVCGISGTTLPMCWKVLCFLNMLSNEVDFLIIRSHLFLYILACYSFLASDGGHSLNEVLSSFKMIFCIIQIETDEGNSTTPFSPKFIQICNHFFHDILIYDQSFERDRSITDLERKLLTVEKKIYEFYAKEKKPIGPDQNYYRFFQKIRTQQPMKDRIFAKTTVPLFEYINYYCPLQQDDSLYTESKFDFFKKENNETLGFGKYKNKKGPQNKKKGLRREKSPVFDRGTIKFKKI